jgi:peptidoglycan/xylan/chitin deacetylase (PgdA/CDA1 family)
MDDGFTALRDQPRPGPSAGESGSGARRRAQPHHVRRRAVALTVLVGFLLIVWLSAGSGGPTAVHRAATAPVGFFTRIQTLAGDQPGSFSSAQQVALNAGIDRTLAYTPLVRFAGAQHRELALTFDDGPGPFTPQVLSILEHESVPGTFFQVGSLEKDFHASTSEMVSRGFVIGDHTESHAPMSHLSPAEQQAQLLQQISAAGAYNAPFPRLFRPPYGYWNSSTLALLRSNRMLMVLWTVDTNDYRRLGVSAIVNSVLSGAQPGAIVLMHDGGGDRSETVAALPTIISRLRARGYKLVSVPQLLLDNPAPANQQISASQGGGGG